MKELSAIEKAQVSNIIKKSKAGKVLTKREEEMVTRYEASLRPNKNPYDIDTTAMVEFFEVTKKTIAAWANQGMPKESYGIYNLKKCFDWWLENIIAGKEDSDSSITEVKKQYWQQKVISERTKNEVLAGKLIPSEKVFEDWAHRAADLRQSMLAMASRMAPALAGKPSQEVRISLEAEARRMLETFCRSGEYTDQAAAPKPTKKRGRKRVSKRS